MLTPGGRIMDLKEEQRENAPRPISRKREPVSNVKSESEEQALKQSSQSIVTLAGREIDFSNEQE
jgi:hypothetical protein